MHIARLPEAAQGLLHVTLDTDCRQNQLDALTDPANPLEFCEASGSD
jgi:hypothetical protein